MRIALVTPRYPPANGGVEQVVAHLARGLAALGEQVEVLTQAEAPGDAGLETVGGVGVRRFAAPWPDRQAQVTPGLWAFLGRNASRYDVIHAHNYHGLLALVAAVAATRPLVFSPHYHGTGHTLVRRLLHVPYRACGRYLFDRAARVLCDSEAEAMLVRRHFPRASPRIQVLPPGVAVAEFRDAQPFPPGARQILVCSGRLEPYKQIDRLIAAMPHLGDRFQLVVIGDGSAHPSLAAQAHRLGLSETVRFVGRLDDALVRRWVRTAAVYVTLSRHEAYGLSAAEALAAGTQVLASAIPAYREQVQRFGSSRITLVEDPYTPRQLAETIAHLAGRRQSTSGPAPDVPSWERVVAATLAAYRAVAL